MSAIIKVLFVCMGNICRSPAGENVMNDLLKKKRLTNDISCDSAGTIGFHVGEPPDSRMSAELRKRDVVVNGFSRQVNARDLKVFDYILAMDEENLRDLHALDSTDEYASKIKPFCSFLKNHSDSKVPDPYYGGADGFAYVADLVQDGCEGLIEEIMQGRG